MKNARVKTIVAMRPLWAVLCLAALPVFAQTPPDSAKVETTALSAIRRQLACYCSCGMTVQDCLGGMVCSESRALSKEVSQMMQAGKSRDEILQAMAAKHGESILAAPTKKGFNLMAWILPFAALAAGGVIVAMIVKHWHKHSSLPAPSSGKKAETQAADFYGSRFEEEFRKFQN